MKRKLILLVTVLLFIVSCVFNVSASSPRLIDEADLLSSSEFSDLEAKLNEISTRYGMDVVILTTESTDNSTPMEYADDYYDYNGYAKDGLLLLVSMEDSDWWISTAGYAITAFTDAGIEYIGEQFVPYLSDGDYYEGFDTFASLCDSFISKAESGDPYDTHNLPKEPFSFVINLGISLVLGLVAAFIVTTIMKSKLKTVVSKAKADDYLNPGSLEITYSRDFHLYTHLSRTERPQDKGGSSTHTSSSGRTHGGGGGKF